MKHVLEHINECSVRLNQNPVFAYMRDATIDARKRLRFVPCTTHFIMTYADMCRFVLPVNPPRDRYEELANANLAEESDHWKWFLADLTSMSLDPDLPFTDTVRLLWSDSTRRARMLSYELIRMSASFDSFQRLIMVLSIEATGKVALEASAPIGQEVARDLGRNLVYFGPHHLDSELGHTLAGDTITLSLVEVELAAETRRVACGIVDQIFEIFSAFLHEASVFMRDDEDYFAAARREATAT